MDGLAEALEMYGGMTKNLIEALKNGDYDNLKYLADERERIIEYIKTLKYSKAEFKEICDRFQIVECQQLLDITAAQKKIELKKNLDGFLRARNAASSYSKRAYHTDGIFNKKV